MFKQLITGLLAGLIITIFIAQRSEWVHHELEAAIRDLLQESMHCSLSCTVTRLNFFVPTLELSDISFKQADQEAANCQWAWSAKRYTTGFSWLDLLTQKKLNLWVEMHDLNLYSDFHDTEIAILPHLNALVNEVALDIPTSISSLSIKHGRFQLTDAEKQRSISLHAHADMHTIHDEQKITISCVAGSGVEGDTLYFNELGGTIHATIKDEDQLVSCQTDCHALVPLVDIQSPLYFSGLWYKEKGNWHVYNAEHKVDAHLTLHEGFDIDGNIAFQKFSYLDYPYELSGNITLHKRKSQWHGDLDAQINEAQFGGSWQYDQEQDRGLCRCENKTALTLPFIPYWSIHPQSLTCTVKRDAGICSMQYQGAAIHELLDTIHQLQGELIVGEKKAELRGRYNEETYAAAIALEETPYLIDADYRDAHGESQLHCSAQDADGSMECALQFSFVRTLIKRIWNYDLQGQGSFKLKLKREHDLMKGTFHLADGAIRLPETYNFINGFESSFVYDQATKKLAINDMKCHMHAGSVRCQKGRIVFDERLKPNFFCIPLLFEQCMLNFKRDLFALVSGTITMSKAKNEIPSLSGNLFIERAQLKENLLSQEFQKQLGAYSSSVLSSHTPELNCDVTIETMHPIRIDTNILKTNAAVHLAITNNLADPQVKGAVRLMGGTIEFPYKPLMISEGTMYLVPGQLYNPLIELRAKNKIKNHTVSLQVTGSLASHHILFDASPPLSEEQIISLLLVGSHEESLATMAPALLMQNLKHALFGINEPTVFEKYMHKIAKPLNIHLVPSFTDQTGRGGLRGALEIDLNDRWRAMIQKNFTLTEDTRFELDYLLSDDITIRTIRDERRDVGSEVEMKWKF